MGRHFTAEEQKQWLQSQPRKPLSSKIILTDEEGKLFFTKPNYKPGWSLVGGMVDEGESPLGAVLRETFEETGLNLSATRLTFLGVRYGVSKNSGDDYVHFLFSAQLTSEEVRNIRVQTDEVEDSRWVAMTNAEEEIDIKDHTWLLAKQAIDEKRALYSDKDEAVISSGSKEV